MIPTHPISSQLKKSPCHTGGRNDCVSKCLWSPEVYSSVKPPAQSPNSWQVCSHTGPPTGFLKPTLAPQFLPRR